VRVVGFATKFGLKIGDILLDAGEDSSMLLYRSSGAGLRGCMGESAIQEKASFKVAATSFIEVPYAPAAAMLDCFDTHSQQGDRPVATTIAAS